MPRWKLRGGHGRYCSTLERRFGLSVEVCEQCRQLNPHEVGTAKPERCHNCGAPLTPPKEEGGNNEGIR